MAARARMAQPRAYARRILLNLALDDAHGRAQRRDELDGVSVSAIADEPATDLLAGCSPGTVKSNASRGCARRLAPIPNPTQEL
jgi:hypothetical protein